MERNSSDIQVVDDEVRHSAAHHGAIEYPRDSLCGLDPKFKNPFAHGPGVGHAKIWTIYLHSLGIPEKTSENASRQSEDLFFYSLAIEGDGPDHDHTIAYPL